MVLAMRSHSLTSSIATLCLKADARRGRDMATKSCKCPLRHDAVFIVQRHVSFRFLNMLLCAPVPFRYMSRA